ncbi:hypothetical protein CTM97_18880 [Photobacterium phosphoreum]|uniref:Uncharacterized protein n=1 Tax=Photobacterium phosphoreum TaxID=659 RepID=A0A2T3JPW5_PHOPO|nr:hypothetical protein [Photobacterium phosphoreum]PSU24720.1 hypothetical protein CTM96_12335 [Photobacterium phosphoreum]PSU38584.1 hypothetical protein CTM97_18880 [Photobacterium phosphoreum]PSU51106.1 hypothetical protein C9J18_12995 [Photobacterium phosphoreum]
MSIICITTFLEDMDHEFNHIKEQVKLKGFKVDGTAGIKPFCSLCELKSVDYFYENTEKNTFLFYEFSNLPDQHMSLTRISDGLKGSDDGSVTKKELVNIRKKIRAEIQHELVKKFNDTSLINANMRSKITNIPVTFDVKPTYVVVVPPIDPSILGNKTGDIIKFLDHLKSTLRSSIPKEICARVNIQDVRALF